MSSPVKDVRDTIRARWEALTPPTDPVVRYRRVRAVDRSTGVIQRRQFFFVAPAGGQLQSWGDEFSRVRMSFLAFIRFDLDGLDIDALFDTVVDEAVLLMNTVNLFSGWGDGVLFARAESFEVRATPDGEVDLVLKISTETEESDGSGI